MHTLQAFYHLPKYISTVANLSFDGNVITKFEELDSLKEIKLREIVLSNNPLKQTIDETKYRSEVLRRFPNLKYLDGKKVEPLVSFGLPSYMSGSLPPIKGNLFDSSQTQSLVETFLKKYFEMYDAEKRSDLVEAYTDNSYFSLSASSDTPHAYKSKSRNLLYLKDAARKKMLLHVGKINIVHFLSSLPQTRHEFTDVRVDSFVMKDISTTPILYINIHGSFREATSTTSLSYNRTFLLSPVQPNSSSAIHGWPAVVLNDQLHVHGFAALPPCQQPPQTTQPQQM